MPYALARLDQRNPAIPFIARPAFVCSLCLILRSQRLFSEFLIMLLAIWPFE